MEGEGFEPSKAEPADLQSAPFDRSGIPPSMKNAYFIEKILKVKHFFLYFFIFFQKPLEMLINCKVLLFIFYFFIILFLQNFLNYFAC